MRNLAIFVCLCLCAGSIAYAKEKQSKHDIWDFIGTKDFDMARKEILFLQPSTFDETMHYLLMHAYISHKEGDQRGVFLHFKCMDKILNEEMANRYGKHNKSN